MSAKRKRRGKKLRVILLCHEELVPPDSIDGLTDKEIADWRTEFDVLTTLRDLGHAAEPLGMGEDVDAIRRAVLEFEPDICFNMLVEFHGAANYDQHIASYLELLKVPYTGCNPRGLTLARDKALSKKILQWHGLPVPHFGVFQLGKKVRRPEGLEFPLFVKSVNEEASLGISRKSIVSTDHQLAERVRYIHEKVGTDAIAEEYIEGREFYVGVIGNERVDAFPLWELHIPGLPEGAPKIATRKVKWDLEYQEKHGIRIGRAKGLSEEMERRIARLSRRICRRLGTDGCARIDFRLDESGELYFLEANPNPDIGEGEEFASAAKAAGIDYPALLQKIVNLGIRRAERG